MFEKVDLFEFWLNSFQINIMDIIIEIAEILNSFEPFRRFIDLSKTIKILGRWIVRCSLSSVDVTGIYYGHLHIIRYLICLFYLLSMITWFFVLLAFIVNDFLFSLIDNEYFPKNTRVLLITALAFLLLVIAVRIDTAIDEWYNHLRFFKFAYYAQENRIDKVGLTKHNYFKISVFAKLCQIIVIYGYTLILCPCVVSVVIYIIIHSKRFMLYFGLVFIIYGIFVVVSTISLIILIAFMTVYYYKLLFDQINEQIQLIERRSIDSVALIDQMRLLRLIQRHNCKARDLNGLSRMLSRSSIVFFIAITFFQIVPLNMYIDSDSIFYKILYMIYLSASLTIGFGVVFASSLQISSAHKPVKLIYQILTKNFHQQNISINFKWKVINLHEITIFNNKIIK